MYSTDPRDLERGVRQLLANGTLGELAGLWLLVPEHLRLGTWDLLVGWSQRAGERVEPRLALQLIHEAALCSTGVRQGRTLTQQGFELLNGLPFLASDPAIHELLDQRTIEDSQALQVALGKLRRSLSHFAGNLLAIDPHRMRSYSKRIMRRHRKDEAARPFKVGQICFTLDADTCQPLCFGIGSSAQTATKAAIEQLRLAQAILGPRDGGIEKTLVVADMEHLTAELFDQMRDTPFDLLAPMPKTQALERKLRAIPKEKFQRHWAGYSVAKQPYQLVNSRRDPLHQLVQRTGERPEEYWYKAFLSTTDRDPVTDLTLQFPKRWHLEEFFNANQALGWNRGGTMNLNIRYGQMTMALIAQALLHQLRGRFGEPWSSWDAAHFATAIFRGLSGAVSVTDDTIYVTYYNAPDVEMLRTHYEQLPKKLERQGIDPRIPWLYGFKLDFQFR
jgi:hypothetical protein